MSEKVIDTLNAARARELGAVLQYMRQHYELADAGYGRMAKIMKETAIEEMKHAEKCAERILTLGGTPTNTPDAEVQKGQTVEQMLETDITIESGAVEMYNNAIRLCGEERDAISRKIFEELLGEEDEHVERFRRECDHVKNLGLHYLARQADD